MLAENPLILGDIPKEASLRDFIIFVYSDMQRPRRE
jgi:hypothetical protein